TRWLRQRMLARLLAVPPHRPAASGTGDLVGRLTAQAADAGQAGPALVLAALSWLPSAGSLVALAWLDPRLAIAFGAGTVAVGLVLRAFGRRASDAAAHYLSAQSDIAQRLTEALAGARTIAAAGTQEREHRRILTPLRELGRHGVRSWRLLATASAQAALVAPLVQIAVVGTGGWALAAGHLTAGQLFAASQYAAMGTGFGALVGQLQQVARARAGTRRVGAVFDVEPLRFGRTTLPPGPGVLRLTGVTVRESGATLLDDVDLSIPGGSTVAVVGTSGAGKSTLAAVVGRLRDPDAGTVRLDGVALPDLTEAALRAAVGLAFERPVLVGRTIADALGEQGDPDRAPAALRDAAADRFVAMLPDGVDTTLDAAPLSGGERQRLGLARLRPGNRVVVLDDATSSLDTVTEMQVSRAQLAGPCRTRLIVTHRPAVAARAELVVWLDAGRVRAVGPHTTLIGDPAYRKVFA
ncbi:MAG: ABC transporter ATP-binding protein, partial [Actinocatenispora sp.]